MSAKELLPCPFCGKPPEEADRASSERPGGRIYFIVCRCGGFTASAHQHGETKAEVTAKWNSRWSAPAAVPGPLEGEQCLDCIKAAEKYDRLDRRMAARGNFGIVPLPRKCAKHRTAAPASEGKVEF